MRLSHIQTCVDGFIKIFAHEYNKHSVHHRHRSWTLPVIRACALLTQLKVPTKRTDYPRHIWFYNATKLTTLLFLKSRKDSDLASTRSDFAPSKGPHQCGKVQSQRVVNHFPRWINQQHNTSAYHEARNRQHLGIDLSSEQSALRTAIYRWRTSNASRSSFEKPTQ